MLDREVFIDSLKGKLRDDIKMIIHECQDYTKAYVDVVSLNKKLKIIISSASIDGLSEDDWLEVIFELCPKVYDKLDFGPIAA